MTKIIYKNLTKSDSLNSLILNSLGEYNLQDAHITLEKRKKIYHMKASLNRFVVSKKDYDLYSLADDVITALHKQIKSYEDRKFSVHHKRTHEEEEIIEPVQKVKKFIIKPMNQDNALEHMRLLGHKFYIYIDENNKPILLFENDGEVYSQTAFPESTISEAIVKLLDDIELEYYAFIDTETGVLTVVYKRKSGDVGIIDASL